MLDYSEGCIDIKKKTSQVYDLLIHHRYDEAREVCIELIADSRSLYHQIQIQQENDRT
jgi:hypothetical protein